MNTQYTTKQGDRLDAIAYAAYGSSKTKFENGLDAVGAILRANKGLSADTVLEGGLTISIPILDDAIVNNQLLPPWLS